MKGSFIGRFGTKAKRSTRNQEIPVFQKPPGGHALNGRTAPWDGSLQAEERSSVQQSGSVWVNKLPRNPDHSMMVIPLDVQCLLPHRAAVLGLGFENLRSLPPLPAIILPESAHGSRVSGPDPPAAPDRPRHRSTLRAARRAAVSAPAAKLLPAAAAATSGPGLAGPAGWPSRACLRRKSLH
jgi:hypothetical protein